MPWFKVDDKLHDHKKARKARKAAMGVWVLAGSWSGGNLTDGFIPDDVAKRWGTSHDFAALVSAGLWKVSRDHMTCASSEPHAHVTCSSSEPHDGVTCVSENGWQFVNWSEFQPLKSEIEAERQRKVEAGRKGGRATASSKSQARAEAPATKSAYGRAEPPSPSPNPSPKETKTVLPTAVAVSRPDGFDLFWNAYSKKHGRKSALIKYKIALGKPGVTAELLLDAATTYIAYQRAEGAHPQFTKDPATWLHGEHWNDERSSRARKADPNDIDWNAAFERAEAADLNRKGEIT